MNDIDKNRMNDLATKIIENSIRPEEEQEFVQLYNVYIEHRTKLDDLAIA